MKEMTATELQSYLAIETSAVLIDVREAHELSNGVIEGANHIPMQQVSEVLEQLEPHRSSPIILICRTGNRSGQVGQFLEGVGFSNVINLIGGMNAWAADIDPTMQTY